jgi:hypothetical protein
VRALLKLSSSQSVSQPSTVSFADVFCLSVTAI